LWTAIQLKSRFISVMNLCLLYSVILSLGNQNICRLAYKGAWMPEGAIFSICSRQTLFCNIQGEYMLIFIGNHAKIKKLLRNVWAS
jgi:hypothetical protein